MTSSKGGPKVYPRLVHVYSVKVTDFSSFAAFMMSLGVGEGGEVGGRGDKSQE